MELKVKDFAKTKGVSDSIVYRHIRQHKDNLADHIIKHSNGTWLDDYAQEYISGLMITNPVVVSDSSDRAELDSLKNKNNILMNQLIAAQQKIIDLQGNMIELEVARKQIEYKESELQQARKEVDQLKSELDAQKKKKWWEVLLNK